MIDGRGNPAVPHQTVIIRNGKIDWIGDDAKAVVPRDGIDVCGTFSDFLSGLINEQGGAYRAGVDRVEILEDGSAAHVYFKDGRKLLFSADSIHWNQPSNSYDFMGESRPERRLRVSFGFIDQIEIWLNSPEIGALLSDCAP